MNSIIKTFWDICRFRLGPQDVPGSNFLLGLVAFFYVVISTSVAGFELPPVPALFSSIVGVGLLAGVTRLALWIREMDARWLQTTIAFLGTGVIFNFIAVPILWVQLSYGEHNQPPLIVLLGVVLFFWNVAVMAHILRHALNTPFIVGLGMAFIYIYISFSVYSGFFAVKPG